MVERARRVMRLFSRVGYVNVVLVVLCDGGIVTDGVWGEGDMLKV